MGRILGIDYGRKRCGVAVTDIFQISINPIDTFSPDDLIDFLKSYLPGEDVDRIVIGWPTHTDGKETYLATEINSFLTTFAKLFPDVDITKVDESYSSYEAKNLIFDSGKKKKQRKDKALLDKMSAVILIKRFLEEL